VEEKTLIVHLVNIGSGAVRAAKDRFLSVHVLSVAHLVDLAAAVGADVEAGLDGD
jgi:hypothetical protein